MRNSWSLAARAFVSVICLGFSLRALAGAGTWTSGGPFGASVYALAVHPTTPSTLYAGTGGQGVFKSTDAGGTWAGISGFGNVNKLYVNALAIDPKTPSTVYAGVYPGTSQSVCVFKSTDSGGTWTAASTGISSEEVKALAINPSTPSTLYAGGQGGVFKATDSGGTWAAAGLGTYAISALVINPTTPSTLLAGAWGHGVFKSTDSGGTWIEASNGLGNWYVNALAIDPKTPSTLYAGTDGGFPSNVFKSTDSGGTWATASAGLTAEEITELAIDPATPSTLYAGTQYQGVFKSMNSGATWAAANTGLTSPHSPYDPYLYIRALAVSPTAPSTLYTGLEAGGGVFRSTDSGGTWAAANTGLTTLTVYTLAINPATPSTLYAGTAWQGIFKSTDSGSSWRVAGQRPLDLQFTPLDARALAIDPAVPSTLYAGALNKVLKSTDSGGTWTTASSGPPNHSTVNALAIDPTSPSTLYAAANGVYKSTDSGGTWAAPSTGATNLNAASIAINPTTPSTLYSVTWEGGVYKSTDSGGTWAAASTGLSTLKVAALAIDPTTPSTLYAGTNGGVFKSTNSGSNWVAANAGLSLVNVKALAIHAPPPSTLYAGGDGGVFKSTDSGGTWTAANTGPLASTLVYALSAAPTGTATVYAGLYGGSAWQLTPLTGGAGNCVPGSTTLCTDDVSGDRRFRVGVNWSTVQGGGGSGPGNAVSTASLGVTRGGLFWFFGADNPEMLVKVLNGCSVNGNYWVFTSAGTNVGLTTTVTDTVTGLSKQYVNPDLTTAAPVQDTLAFSCTGARGEAASGWLEATEVSRADGRSDLRPELPDVPPVQAESILPSVVYGCTPSATTLCIDDTAGDRRFSVTVDWATAQGAGASGHANAISTASVGISRGGLFWFFGSDNPEMLVKILNGCSVNGKYWIFYSAGTNVGLTTRVTDTKTGTAQTFTNPDMNAAQPVANTAGFACN